MPGSNELPPVGGPDEIRHISDHVFPEEAQAQPEANAPDPAIMREDFINILLGKNPACGRHRAEQIVDAILTRQMEYYEHMAEAELDTSSVTAAAHVQELSGIVTALITMGAAVLPYMGDQDKWRRLALRARNTMTALQGMVG